MMYILVMIVNKYCFYFSLLSIFLFTDDGIFPFFTMPAASHNAKAVEVGYSPHKFL